MDLASTSIKDHTETVLASGTAAGDPRRILLILGHPRRESLCGALADAYEQAAREAGADLRRIDLADLDFARDVTAAHINDQPVEPDLQRAEAALFWAEHLVFVYPTWWGTCPALLKAFFDRVLRPGLAFREKAGLNPFEGLLGGRSAHLIATRDTPAPIYRFVYGNPGPDAIAKATLGFCGIRPVEIAMFGPVRTSDREQRARWIARAAAAGSKAARHARKPASGIVATAGAWLRALRLQFYPMTWAAYALGAVAATGGAAIGAAWFWMVYAALFLVEATAVFVNEIADVDTDRRNENFGRFTGGSRVLIDGALSRRALAIAAGGCFAAAWLLALAAVAIAPGAALPWLAAFAILSALAVAYTLPPVKLCWRTLGEADVAITHSIGVLMVGWLAAGGDVGSATPWALGLPMALAVLPSITLAGLPDRDADAAAGKKTLAVRFGARPAIVLAALATVLAAVATVGVSLYWTGGAVLAPVIPPIVLHGTACIWLLARLHAAHRGPAARIDGVLVCALSYMVWFAVGPLVALL